MKILLPVRRLLLALLLLLLAGSLPGLRAWAAKDPPSLKGGFGLTLEGTITVQGKPLGGVKVRLEGDLERDTLTDRDGRYRFTGLAAGTYRVTPYLAEQTVAPGYRVVSLLAENATGQDFRVATFDLSGRVLLLEEGKAGCTVILTGPRTLSATTDKRGAFTFRNLMGGTYELMAALPGQEAYPETLKVTISGADVPDADIRIGTYSVAGTVTLAGQGFPGMTVRLEGAQKASTLTDAAGRFAFPRLPRGSYRVIPSLAGQSTEPAHRSLVITNRDERNLNFALLTSTLTGRVLNNGEGLPNCTVSLGGDSSSTCVTDRTGTYTFSGLLKGRYQVTPLMPGQSFQPSSLQLVLTGGNVRVGDLAVRTFTIAGRVTHNQGGVTGATVSLAGPQARTVVTDANGAFRFSNLPAGSYRLTPTADNQSFQPTERWVSLDDEDSRDNLFAVRTFDLCGRVTHEGKGLAEARLLLGGEVNLITTSDREGSFCFRGLPNGSYTISARYHDQMIIPQEEKVLISNGPRSHIDFFLPSFIWHVDKDARGTTIDGLTWKTAFRHPADAVRSASLGDKVWVAKGVYGPPPGNGQVVAMKDGVELYGRFAGTETSPSQRDPGKNVTILDGMEKVAHVVVGASNTRLDGFSLQGGKANGEDGGGLFGTGCRNLFVSGCYFFDNSAVFRNGGGRGGGLFLKDSSGLLQDCRFSQNTVPLALQQPGGGGVHLEDGSFLIERCVFSGNKSSTGGGLMVVRGEARLNDCSFTSNFAMDGAGIYMTAASGEMVNCLLAKNVASHNGALYTDEASDLKVRNCTITANEGGWWTGGILNARNSSTVVSNSILWGNSGAQVYNHLCPTPLAVSYSDVQAGHPGTGNISLAPRFANPDQSDFRLLPGSPGVDAGEREGSPSVRRDLGGNPRVWDGDGDSQKVVDMGAFELVP